MKADYDMPDGREKNEAGAEVAGREKVEQQRREAADTELIQAQGRLEYGVLLTAVGGLAVRLADKGFQFIEDYAVRLREVQAVFSSSNSNNDHIRILFRPVRPVALPIGVETEVELELRASEGSLLWKVIGLDSQKSLSTSLDVANDILQRLSDISDRFDSSVSRDAEVVPGP